MSFSFDPSLPTLRDQIRLRLADTDSTNAVFSDESIGAMLGMYSYDEACAQLAESAGSNFARMAETVTQDTVRYVYAGRAKFYLELATSIRAMAQPAAGAPAWTGATGGQMSAPNLRDYRTD